MLKAIINLINALADRIRPCRHDWDEIAIVTTRTDYDEKYHKWIYRCTKCGESKIISSK